MRIEDFETLIYIFFFWFLIIQIRNLKRVLFRVKIEKRIYERLRFLRKKNVLSYDPGSVFRYQACIGYQGDDPKKVIVLQSGVHGGLEMFPIYLCLRVVEYLHFKCAGILEDNKVQIIAIPIVNYWGFRNYRRTNWFTDLVRNSGYKTKHSKRIPLLKGWSSIREVYVWPFALLKWSTWYFKGFWVKKETRTLLNLLGGLHTKHGRNLYCYDLHTGNTSDKTHVWTHELFKGEELAFIKKLVKNMVLLLKV